MRWALLIVLTATATGLWYWRMGGALAGIEWPPKLGEAYPDLILTDQTGESVRLSEFAGKVLFIEYVGMSCQGCQAFSGAHRLGAFGGVKPQKGLKSIETYFPRYSGGLKLSDERIVFIQILLFDLKKDVPTADDARRWAEHFKLDREKGEIVLAGHRAIHNEASYHLVPGFQLVDRDFRLRYDSTGHEPRHDLYTELLPQVRKVLEERPRSSW